MHQQDQSLLQLNISYQNLDTIQEFNREQLQIFDRLNLEGFSNIFQGQLKGIKVMVKIEDSQPLKKQLFNIYRTLEHPNILSPLSYIEVDSQIRTIYPYNEEISLDNFISRENGESKKEEKQELKILQDIIEGLIYLHSNQINLKSLEPSNILIDQNLQAKICFFEDSSASFPSQTTISGTKTYEASELFEQDNQISEQEDVYSFGKIATSLLTRNQKKQLPEQYQFLFNCMNKDPLERPSMRYIQEELN